MSNTIERKAAGIDDDGEYVLRCQRGDTKAFETLVERHQKKMLNIAYRMIGDYDDACDITQDAFVAAYKAIGTFKGEAKFSTWLYRIVINQSKNRLKQLRAHRDGRRYGDDCANTKDEEATGSSSRQQAGPGILMERRERDAHVQRCITALDADYREVVVLRDIQGFSYEEISAMLKIPDGTVKSRLARARNALRACLQKVMGDL